AVLYSVRLSFDLALSFWPWFFAMFAPCSRKVCEILQGDSCGFQFRFRPVKYIHSGVPRTTRHFDSSLLPSNSSLFTPYFSPPSRHRAPPWSAAPPDR